MRLRRPARPRQGADRHRRHGADRDGGGALEKYLRYLREHFFDDPNITKQDQALFAFAAYNAGPGNIEKARAMARKMNLDPNVWFGNVEVATARTVSREPEIYVRNILKYYVTHRLLTETSQARDKAKRVQE